MYRSGRVDALFDLRKIQKRDLPSYLAVRWFTIRPYTQFDRYTGYTERQFFSCNEKEREPSVSRSPITPVIEVVLSLRSLWGVRSGASDDLRLLLLIELFVSRREVCDPPVFRVIARQWKSLHTNFNPLFHSGIFSFGRNYRKVFSNLSWNLIDFFTNEAKLFSPVVDKYSNSKKKVTHEKYEKNISTLPKGRAFNFVHFRIARPRPTC